MRKSKLLVYFLISGFFLAGGWVADVVFDSVPTEMEQATAVTESLHRELDKVESDAQPFLTHHTDPMIWKDHPRAFFLIDSLTVLQWTQNDFLPDLQLMLDTFSVKLIQVSQGDFLLRKWPVHGSVYLLCVIPLQKDYHIVNNYLAPEFNPALFTSAVDIGEPAGKGVEIKLRDGRTAFRIHYQEGHTGQSRSHIYALISYLIAILFFLAGVVELARRLHRNAMHGWVFVTLAFFLLGCRMLMVKANFPNHFSDYALFDPHRFASSNFNASMGDLLLNSVVVLVLCLYLFLNYPHFPYLRRLFHKGRMWKLPATIFSLVICFLAILFPYLFIEIIYHNSSISLEITDSVQMDIIRWAAFLSTLIGNICGFLIVHIFFRIAFRLTRPHPADFWLALAGAAGIFLAYFLFTQKDYWLPLQAGLVFLPLLYLGSGLEQFTRITFKTYLYFLLVIITLAAQGALSLKKFNEERRIADQFRFGANFLVDQDVLGEFLLNESVNKISKDTYIQSRFLSPFLSKTGIRQKVREFYLSTYFDRYDVQVYLYDAGGEPYDKPVNGNLADWMNTYSGETYKTTYPGIYFINTPTVEATKQYLVIIPIERHHLSAGFVVLHLKLKRVIPKSVYPALLVDNRFSHYFKSQDFSYAFYSKGQLTNSFGDFNYEKDFSRGLLGDRLLYRQGIVSNNHFHAGIEDRDGQFVVVTAHTYPWFYVVTNFSFLFLIGLIPVLALLVATSVLTWLKGGRLNYSARIQLYVYLAFFLPLLTVSVTTLSLTKNSAEEQLRVEYEERSRTLGERISGPLEDFISQADHSRSENLIIELAKLADLDASVYGSDGVLMVSSQPLIFQNQLTSTLIHRNAWNSLIRDKDASYVANEKIGKLQYNCSYVVVKAAESANVLGILSIPFFASEQSLQKIQINALANILSVFAVVFILFSVLSFVISNGLTYPLRFIARSIKRTTLTEKNQMIQWNSKDEIGLLAQEYNRMIHNLEQSRIELERVQKEAAWREIAKQVAHEIKNPLTPMKLTLQQMEQAWKGEGMTPERSRKAVETMLTQLEILNEIATSFSTFARMPAASLDLVDLNTLLTSVVSLHQNYAEGTVTMEIMPHGLWVIGNEQMLSRVFGNMILNGLQSGEEGKVVHIRIAVVVSDKACVLSFKDDGRGIDPAIQDKVFLPHFSTKRTGSGLGLAIALQGIEQSGGRIWFETSPGKGTTFFIELVRGEKRA